MDVGKRKDRGLKRQRSSVTSSDFGGGERTPLVSPDGGRTRGEWPIGSGERPEDGSATLGLASGRPGFESQVHRVVLPYPFGSEVTGTEGGDGDPVERYRNATERSPFDTVSLHKRNPLNSLVAAKEKILDEARMPESEAVRMLLARIQELEAAFREFERETTAARKELGQRLEMSQLERRALEQRHEALGHELDENHKRGVKTEQYLDAMRRDLGKAIGSQQSKLTYIVKSTMNNGLYYILAYLVPVFAFLVRGFRDLFGAVRQRLVRSRPTHRDDTTAGR